MAIKILAALLAVTLFVIYTGAIVLKMKDVELGIVVVIGFVLMAIDLLHSFRSDD